MRGRVVIREKRKEKREKRKERRWCRKSSFLEEVSRRYLEILVFLQLRCSVPRHHVSLTSSFLFSLFYFLLSHHHPRIIGCKFLMMAENGMERDVILTETGKLSAHALLFHDMKVDYILVTKGCKNLLLLSNSDCM